MTSSTEVSSPRSSTLYICHADLPTGINTRCIGLAPRDNAGQPKVVKLARVAYHTRLLDLHRSNSFGPHTPFVQDELQVPEAW